MSRQREPLRGLPEGLADLGDWHISEFTCCDPPMSVRGKFEISRFQRLTAEQESFLITFLRCRGVLSAVERELGISYPTVRSRLDALLAALGLTAPDIPENGLRTKVSEKHKEILDRLEAGELSPEEAKKAMKEAQS